MHIAWTETPVPTTSRLPRTVEERAYFREALAETHDRGEVLLDELREQRSHQIRMSESIAVERRILRDDFAHWTDESE
jgi:hypothetical protein